MSETTIEPALLISGESALTVDQLAALSGSDTGTARAVGLTVRQRSSGRFLDAHENSANDFRLVTRPPQNNTSQRWQLMLSGYLVTARQKVNGRFLDAYESDANGFRLVTRPGQDNDSQRWVLRPAGGGSYTVQQLVNGRYVDAHEDATKDFAVVTRPAQNNDSQRWIFG